MKIRFLQHPAASVYFGLGSIGQDKEQVDQEQGSRDHGLSPQQKAAAQPSAGSPLMNKLTKSKAASPMVFSHEEATRANSLAISNFPLHEQVDLEQGSHIHGFP